MKIKAFTNAFSARGSARKSGFRTFGGKDEEMTLRTMESESDDSSSSSSSGARIQVRFAKEPVECDAPAECGEVEELWYSTEECKKLKEADNYTRKIVCTTVSMASSSRESKPSYGGALIKAHEECSNAQQETDEQGNIVSPLSQAQQDELKEQLNLWGSRVGLEGPVIKSVAKKVICGRRKLLLAEAKKLTSGDYFPEDDRLTAISRPAKLFAMHIGMAQAP